MPFLDHLEELRWRILWSLLAIVLATVAGWFGFAAQIMIGFGVVTELPLVVVILAALGLVTPQLLARNRRYSIALSAVAAALLTPPDAVSMLIMMVPLLLLYEVSIVCAWIVTKRRARREQAASASGLVLLLLVAPAGRVEAQGVPPPRDTGRVRADSGVQGRVLDSATARRLGLPTAPSRSFPASDAVIDSLLKLKGFRVARYVADTVLVEGDSAISLWGQAFVDRDGTKLEADSIRYRHASCRLDATGTPHLFDQSTVLAGDVMYYDTCIRRGTVSQALTRVQQGGPRGI